MTLGEPDVMTDEEDNASWVAHGRRYSVLDNEALSRYFTTLSKLSTEDQARVKEAMDKATDDGWRPKHAVTRALALVDPNG